MEILWFQNWKVYTLDRWELKIKRFEIYIEFLIKFFLGYWKLSGVEKGWDYEDVRKLCLGQKLCLNM